MTMAKDNSKYIWPGCTALVTGASSGMGLEYARQLAAMGCHVVMVSNQAEELEECAKTLQAQYSAKIWHFFCDLARFEAADDVKGFCKDNGLKIDILVNNAGMFFFRELTEEMAPKAEAMLMLHVVTPTRLCEKFGNAMKARGRGYILNVSSVAAGMPVPGLMMYASTKSYLKVFTKALYFEMKPYGVGATALCPGAVATGLYNVLPGLVKILKVAGKFGMVYSPEKMVRRALRAMFRRRRSITPGFINIFFAPIVNGLPNWFVNRVWRKFTGK